MDVLLFLGVIAVLKSHLRSQTLYFLFIPCQEMPTYVCMRAPIAFEVGCLLLSCEFWGFLRVDTDTDNLELFTNVPVDFFEGGHHSVED